MFHSGNEDSSMSVSLWDWIIHLFRKVSLRTETDNTDIYQFDKHNSKIWNLKL